MLSVLVVYIWLQTMQNFKNICKEELSTSIANSGLFHFRAWVRAR